MHDPNLILLLVVVLAAWTAFDLRHALTTGRARSRTGGSRASISRDDIGDMFMRIAPCWLSVQPSLWP
jgi:hypothetical protein